MKIGVVAEGPSDWAVIKNIIAAFNIDSSDLLRLVPDSNLDNTDRELLYKGFSNWVLVKDFCNNEEYVHEFFSIDEDRLLLIQIDTAECDMINYDVQRPSSQDPQYQLSLYTSVKEKMKGWLPEEYHSKVIFAIAIEETEAWLIASLSNRDSNSRSKPKEYLESTLRQFLSNSDYKKYQKAKNITEEYDTLSKSLRKKRALNTAKEHNVSLNELVLQLENLI